MRRYFWIMVLAALLVSGCGTAFSHEFKIVSLGDYTQAPVCTNTITAEDGYGDFLSNGEYLTVIPGLYQKMVPQGMDTVGDDYLLISAYSDKNAASVLFLVEAGVDGKLVKAIELRNEFDEAFTGHVGGVAVTDEYIFLSGSRKMFVVPLDAFMALEATDTLMLSAEINIITNSSFLNYSGGYLWSGDFYEPEDYATDAERHIFNSDEEECGAWVAAYSYGTYKSAAEQALATGSASLSPDFVYLITDRIQGFTIYRDSLVLSQSYGRNNDSALLMYDVPDANSVDLEFTYGGATLPIYFLDSRYLTDSCILPPMAEGISTLNGKVCILFESAASKYKDNVFFLNGKNPTDGVWTFQY